LPDRRDHSAQDPGQKTRELGQAGPGHDDASGVAAPALDYAPARMANFLSASIAAIEPAYYQIGGFFLMSILDDPAMLALAFC
jgi:hypothetical protein